MNGMGAPMGSYNPMANMNGMGMAPAPMPGMNMSMNNMTGMLTPGQIYHQAAAPAPVMSAPAAVMMQQPQQQQQQQQLQPQQQQLTRPVVRAQPPAKPKVHSARPRSPKHDLTARPNDDGKKSGPWSWKEHQLFERAVIVHGWGNWVQVKNKVPGRTKDQCKSHAQKFAKHHPAERARLDREHDVYLQMQSERRYNYVSTLRSIRTALPVMHSTTQSESLPSASKRRNNVEQRPMYAFPPPPMENNNVTIKEQDSASLKDIISPAKKKVVTKPKLPLSRPAVAAPQPVLAAAPQLPTRNNVSVPTETVTESTQEKLPPVMQDNDDDDDGVEVWVQEEVQEAQDESPPTRKEENESSQPRLQEQAADDANENEGLKQVDTTTAAAVGGNNEVLPSVQTEVNKSPKVDNPDVATQVTLGTRKTAAPPQTKTEQLPEPQPQPQQNMIPKITGGGSFTAFMKQSPPAVNPTPAFDPESIDIDTISAQIHERKQQKLGMKNDSSTQELLPNL